MTVSIFAQATAPKSVAYKPVKDLIRQLIVERGAKTFYIGDKGFEMPAVLKNSTHFVIGSGSFKFQC